MESSVPQISCHYHQRPRRFVSCICLQPSCTNQSLLCEDCLPNHLDHEVESLGKVIEDMGMSAYKTGCSDMFRKTRQQLHSLKSSMMYQVDHIRSTLSEKLEHIYEEIKELIERTEMAVLNETICLENMNPMAMSVISVSTAGSTSFGVDNYGRLAMGLKKQLQKHLKVLSHGNQLNEQIVHNMQHFEVEVRNLYEVMRDFMSSTASRTAEIQLMVKKFKSFSFKIEQLELYPLYDVYTPEKRLFNIFMKWSDTFRHENVDVLSEGYAATRGKQASYFNSVAVLSDNVLQEMPPRLYVWTVKMTQLSSLMVIGICSYKASKQHNFVRGYWANPGHGHYVVGSDGYTYSHSDKQINYKRQAFRISKGDLLRLNYDTGRRKLEIHVNWQKKWEFNVQSLPKDDCYRACAYLLDVGDSLYFVVNR